MTHAKKVVLVSSSGYSPERDEPLLREFITAGIKLFCVVGIDAEKWEEALDWLAIEIPASKDEVIITTSHPDETFEEVLEFARQFDPATDTLEVIQR